jgi:hypothetical protein
VPPANEPSADESVRTTNEIDRTLPRAVVSAFTPPSGSWPVVEAAPPSSSPGSGAAPVVEPPAFPPSSGSWPRPGEAPPSTPGAFPATATLREGRPEGSGPASVPEDDVDVDIDAPTGQMSPEKQRKYLTTQPLDPALVPRSPVARNMTQPISAGFLPPNPTWNVLPGTAVTTTTAPLAASPPAPPPQEPPTLPWRAPAPRWHTALLVLSAVALIAAVVMLAITLGGDGATATAPAAGSALPGASAPKASASASASARSGAAR